MEKSSGASRFEKDTYMRNFKIINFVLSKYFEVSVLNADNIPEVPSLFVANHLRFVDTPLILAAYTNATGKPMRALAQKEYTDGKGIRIKGNLRALGAPIKRFVDNTHMIPVNRDGHREDFMQLTRDMSDTFQAGESELVHGDGTRAENGMINKFHTGAVRIGMDNSVPLVPTAIWYEPSETWHPSKVHISFGEPIDERAYNHGLTRVLPKAQRVQRVTNQIESAIVAMSGLQPSGEFMHDIRARQEK